METLEKTLREQTQTLKEQYIEKTKEWANNSFNAHIKRTTWSEVDWCKYFGLEPRPVNVGTSMEFLSFPKNFYNTKNSKTYHNMRTESFRVKGLGLEEYTKREVKKAEIHYENSIIKLTERIMKKGLNEENLKVVTSHIGININTTISDGDKTVKAWTIIAEGEIQKPHYRYLVK